MQNVYVDEFDGWTKNAIWAPSTPIVKRTHIAYLKTPKTGSSTMAVIFLSFCVKHNLTMYMSQIRFLNKTMQAAVLAEGKRYDIFATHTLYNYHFFTQIVENPAIIGLLRHPEERLISHAFYFLRDDQRFDGLSDDDFLNEIVTNTDKYKCKNIMSKYFQISDGAKHDKELLEIELAKIKSEFTLVLVLEMFDESLVLMKRLLNWSFIDIVYSQKNVYTKPKSFLNAQQKEKIRQSEDLDFHVYDYFLHEITRKIRDAGRDFYDELYYFKEVLRQANMFCTTLSEEEEYMFPSSKWEPSFYVSKKDCKRLFDYGMGYFRFKNDNVL